MMDKIVFALLRGVCQMPAYVAYAKGYLRDVGIDAELSIAPTAWTVPQRLVDGEVEFAVIPWTRVAADKSKANRLTLICGSGFEEAAMVVRNGMTVEEVTDVAVPNEGGIKDLTAMALVQRLGWQNANIVRMPSGDGAILSFVARAPMQPRWSSRTQPCWSISASAMSFSAPAMSGQAHRAAR